MTDLEAGYSFEDFLHRLTDMEWLAAALAAPLLIFPTVRPSWTAAALTALSVIWLLRWRLRGEPWPVTPFNGALLLFVLMIPVGVWASALPDLTLPKATGLILGVAVFRAVALSVRSRRIGTLAVIAFCLLGLALTAVGVLSVNWSAKVAALGPVAARIPQLIERLPSMPSGGANPNQLAAVLTLYLPPAVALAAWAWKDVWSAQKEASRPCSPLESTSQPSVSSSFPWSLFAVLPERGWRLFLRGASLAFLIVVAGVLLLTQSRSGWIGGAAGLLMLTAMGGLSSRQRWGRLLGVVLPLLALIVVTGMVLYIGPQRIGETLYGAGGDATVEEVVGSISIAGRVEIWSRALYAIQDFPFTGCGLGTFRRVVHILYPLFLVSPGHDIAHAHNMFLQAALDLGLPGMIAYLTLLMIALVSCWREAREGDCLTRPVALGLAGGLVGLHVYGLADALALGSKPGVAFWFALGLIASLRDIANRSPETPGSEEE